MPNIAILIDAENVLPIYADQLFDQASARGTVVCKEIFGAAQALTTWVEPVLKYAIHPNLTIKASKGKNSSDIALVIGAMELLLAHSIDTVILASSDSDFSSLSVRLRNAGIEVIGMGTEKSNPLWRTSCSSFVVLQQPQKPAQAAEKKPAPRAEKKAEGKKQQPQPDKPDKQPERKAEEPSTHESRVAAIRAFIDRHLGSHGGRVMVSQLISALNGLKEYRVDKKGAGRKPQNYLTGMFGEDYDFEINADGASWVSLKGAAAQAAQAAEEEIAQVAEAVAEPAAEEAPAPEAATQTVEAAAEEAIVEEPAAEEDSEAAQAEGPDPMAMLLEAGIAEDVAGQIVEIFTDSQSLREAYNKLRSTFGATSGREYYQKVKELATGQA